MGKLTPAKKIKRYWEKGQSQGPHTSKAALLTSLKKQIAILFKLVEDFVGLKVSNYKEMKQHSIPLKVPYKREFYQKILLSRRHYMANSE